MLSEAIFGRLTSGTVARRSVEATLARLSVRTTLSVGIILSEAMRSKTSFGKIVHSDTDTHVFQHVLAKQVYVVKVPMGKVDDVRQPANYHRW